MKYETQTDRGKNADGMEAHTRDEGTRDAAEYWKKNARQGRLYLESGKTPDGTTPFRHVSCM